jgi:IS30 family transposase
MISLELKNSENFSIIIDDTESNIMNISNVFKYNIWNCLMLVIEPKSIKKKGTIKVLVNETMFMSSIYFPKGFDFRKITDKEIQFVEELINNRPRKCLGWKTPAEIFAESVALA